MAASQEFLRSLRKVCLCASHDSSQDWSKYDEKLMQAVDYNDPPRVSSLLRKKNLVPTKLDSEGKAAFHLAAMRGNLECMEVILAHRADMMVTDSSGLNVLHLAAKHGHPPCVRRLLQEACPVNVADCDGRTALHHAALSGCISCTELLCDFKAALNSKDRDGSTPLILAAQMSHSELCHYLLHRGAKVNARDLQGRTALMLACENDSVETVEVLVHSGARVSIVDSLGHDAVHYSIASGNALIQHFLQDTSHRKSWASEEDVAEKLAQPASSRQSPAYPKEKSSRQRKRKAPPPPSPPNQDEQEVYEEIKLLRQERANLLQKIRSLEQQLKQQQQLEQHDLDGSSMEKQIRDLQKQLADKEEESDRFSKEVSTLQSQLSLLENEKENTSYDIETLQDEEGELLEFPGAEILLSKKSQDPSLEGLLAALQGQVGSLTAQNKELQEKIQILENYEKDDMEASADFIPIILYDSLKTEFDRLKEQYLEAQAALKTPQGVTAEDTSASCKLVPIEAYEQLKEEYEQKIQAMKITLNETELGTSSPDKVGTEDFEGEAEDADLEAQDKEELIRKLIDSQAKYKKAMAEVGMLQEQIQLGVLSVEETEGLMSHKAEAESLSGDLEKVRMDLQRALEDLIQKDTRVKELEGKLKTEEGLSAEHPSPEENELTVSLRSSLEEVTKERTLLLDKYNKAEEELKNLRKSLEERKCSLDGTSEPSRETDESEKLQTQLSEQSKRHDKVKKKYDKLKADHEKIQQELRSLKEQLSSTFISKQEHSQIVETLNGSLTEANTKLLELQKSHSADQQELAQLRKDADRYQQEVIPLMEHTKVKESLQVSSQELKSKVNKLEQELAKKNKELSQVQKELEARKEGATTFEEHEQIRCTLQAEVNTLNLKLNDMMRKHEKTCTEVFQVQREALFMKSEKHAAEDQLVAVQKQLENLRSESQRIQELHSHIEDSANLVREKDKKITELSKEIFRLKEALNSLSQLSSQAGVLPKAMGHPQHQTQLQGEAEALQKRAMALQQQLAEAERKYNSTILFYRTHLLNAVQGQMGEDMMGLLQQILTMQRLVAQGR
ncbi:ankyrin repeat domain-containing protein 24 [Rhinatrema bivittatum]|uniref:ankyrin repeat domain-containing protein 24 n=1 Tax=Rhinatrema bivittatum TaxID=194408 RepID=UPI00112AD929|nr:ankyrin repeat domain-containing protein 24 [Rhinatrema bivittatum]